MPPRVVLSVIQGDDAGKEFGFDERTLCIVGREDECTVTIRERERGGRCVSRRHFMLDINPPEVRIRDLGSRGGTFVRTRTTEGWTETLIGKRGSDEPDPKLADHAREYPLKDGDEIRIHRTVLRISASIPEVCSECGAEIARPHLPLAERSTQSYVCGSCAQDSPQLIRESHPGMWEIRCSHCGRDVTAEIGRIGRGPPGGYTCHTCRLDPYKLLHGLLAAASEGDRQLHVIRGYKVVKELARGGMGCVCLAEHEATGEHVALKIIIPDKAANDRAITSFRLEANNTKALRHEHIVRLFDYGCSRGTFYFTMEFCEGQTVAQRLRRLGGPMPIDHALDIAFQALDGLDYAHHAEIPNVTLADGSVVQGQGLVHRDIKPGNIFLKREGDRLVAKVGDYGIAKAFEFAGLSGRTRTGVVEGTPAFMPRQQVLKFKYAKPEVDVWAMAATLYCMLTGRYPRDFRPKREDEWSTVLYRRPVPIQERNPDIPLRMATVIDYALDDSKKLNFTTALDLRTALMNVV